MFIVIVVYVGSSSGEEFTVLCIEFEGNACRRELGATKSVSLREGSQN